MLKSTFHGATEVDAARIVVDEISVVGSRQAGSPGVNLFAAGAVDVESLVSEEFRLADGLQAMARASQAGVMKILLRP